MKKKKLTEKEITEECRKIIVSAVLSANQAYEANDVPVAECISSQLGIMLSIMEATLQSFRKALPKEKADTMILSLINKSMELMKKRVLED